MIEKKVVIEMLEQWKCNFGESYMDEMVTLMIDVVINKINSLPETCENK